MGANERFEYMAELFYQDTGMMAPGKDSPIASNREERQQAWDAWVEEFYDELFILHQHTHQQR